MSDVAAANAGVATKPASPLATNSRRLIGPRQVVICADTLQKSAWKSSGIAWLGQVLSANACANVKMNPCLCHDDAGGSTHGAGNGERYLCMYHPHDSFRQGQARSKRCQNLDGFRAETQYSVLPAPIRS